MLPSRGLRAAQIGARTRIGLPRRLAPTHHQFSTGTTQSSLASRRQALLPNATLYSFPRQRSNALNAFSITSIATPRYYTSNNSNDDIASRFPGATQEAPFIPDSAKIGDGYLDSALPELKSDLTTIADPSQVGYLQSLGLEYGFGPSTVMQWLLEHAHIWGGLPWWASIMLTAGVVRAVLFPWYLKLAEFSGKQAALKPIIDPIRQKRTDAQARGDKVAVQAAQNELREVYRDAGGMAGLKYMATPIVQLVFGYCTWKVLSNAVALPVPGFLNGGLLWLTDLTVADPYYILPAAMAVMMHIVIKRGGDTGSSPMMQMKGLRILFMYGLPGISFFVSSWQGAAVQILFVTQSFLATLQAILFRQNTFRRLVGLSPIPKGDEATAGLGKVVDATATRRTNHYRWQAPRTEKPKPKVETSAFKPSTWMAGLQKAAGQKEANPNAPDALKRAHKERAAKYDERRKKEIARQKRIDQQEGSR